MTPADCSSFLRECPGVRHPEPKALPETEAGTIMHKSILDGGKASEKTGGLDRTVNTPKRSGTKGSNDCLPDPIQIGRLTRAPHAPSTTQSNSVGFLHPNNCHFAKPLLERGCFQFGGHTLDQFFLDLAFTTTIALQADFKRHIEKYRMHVIAKALRHLDPLAALVGSKVGSINIVPGHTGDQPGAQERAQGGKNQSLVALFCNVVEKNGAKHIAR